MKGFRLVRSCCQEPIFTKTKARLANAVVERLARVRHKHSVTIWGSFLIAEGRERIGGRVEGGWNREIGRRASRDSSGRRYNAGSKRGCDAQRATSEMPDAARWLSVSQSNGYRIIVIRPPGVEYLEISSYCFGTWSFSRSPEELPSGLAVMMWLTWSF